MTNVRVVRFAKPCGAEIAKGKRSFGNASSSCFAAASGAGRDLTYVSLASWSRWTALQQRTLDAHYEFFGESGMLTARDIMTEGVITILPSCTIQEAIDLLLAENISGLPVVDESNQLVGIVTEFALLAVAYDEHVLGDAVSLHMTTDLLTIDADDPIRKVADLCIVHRVRRVPVMSNGRLAGLISRRDVLKAVYQSTKRPALAR